MKRRISFCLAALLLLSLAGCGARKPTATSTGEVWDPEWTLIGATLGVEAPDSGLIPLDNKDALSISGLYYAAWVIGEAEDFVNADGDTTALYDAQLYVLLQDCADEAAAQTSAAQWQAQEEQTYTVTATQEVVCAGQTFTVLLYETAQEENPYAYGASAFTVYQNHAINAELACRDCFDGDAYSILTAFLDGLHYAA